jgi:DNA invertase Pin-like site-specific DNA recombinase
MKKVIELIRVSTEQQAAADRASIPAQRTVNRTTCQRFGLEIVRSIEIADVSGTSVLEAPEMQELLRLIQSPDIHGVVAREFSRLIRPDNLRDYVLLQEFADSQTILYLPDGPTDLNDKAGRFFGTIRAAMAGMERTELLERIWSAKEEKRRRGELAQSPNVLPFGVGYENGRGFFYKPEAELVREAFREFLAGNQSYANLAEMVGVTPRGMHGILRNPIWTGWRVIDQKRDLSGAGKYRRINGRQADRRKIKRAENEIIRVQVITEPLIPQAEFETVQRIMDIKEQKHWRSHPEYEHRFTYNGFLTCSVCGQIVHTALARRDYYVCRGRRVDHECTTNYMGREKLERDLDGLFGNRLTSPAFVQSCVNLMLEDTASPRPDEEISRLAAEIEQLRRQRGRVIDTYIGGFIDPPERDERLRRIDECIRLTEGSLTLPTAQGLVDPVTLVEAFTPLTEWEYWTRDQKRRVLAALAPDIRVANYEVQSIGLDPALFSNENTRTGRDSWRLRA